MSYKDYISDDEIFDEDDLDEDDFDEEDFDEDDLDEDDDDEPDVYEYKVVGVTFANDDGINRQELLRKIKSKEAPFKGYINYSLRKYSYEGKTAVAVLANGIMIGNIPKENAENIAEHIKYIDKVFVRVFGGEDGKKYGAVVRLTVIPPRIDIEKLLSERHSSSSPTSVPEKPTPPEPTESKISKALKAISKWLKSPISQIVLLFEVIILIAVFIISYRATTNLINQNKVDTSSAYAEKRLDIKYSTLCTIADTLGNMHDIDFKSIVYLNDSNVFSAGAYSPDYDIVRFSFYSDRYNSNANSISLTINSEMVTKENAVIGANAFNLLITALDSNAASDNGSGVIFNNLYDQWCEIDIGFYETEKLSIDYRVINDDIVISIYPK